MCFSVPERKKQGRERDGKKGKITKNEKPNKQDKAGIKQNGNTYALLLPVLLFVVV